MNRMKKSCASGVLLLVTASLLAACQPTVQLQAPSEPITINLNVRIEHEIRVKVDKELDDVFAANPDLF
ncbi:MAG TPA: YnbE family lipoprotein [Pseudomonadales bacterium]